MGPFETDNRKLVPVATTFRATLVDHPRWTFEFVGQIASVSYSESEWASVRKLTELFTENAPTFCRP
jgi:hypothetical protein